MLSSYYGDILVRSLLLIALLGAAPAARAQGSDTARTTATARDSVRSAADSAARARVFRLGTVEVLASDTAAPGHAFSPRVNAADLRRRDRTDAAAALDLLPGVTISAVGPRNESGVFVRGLDLRQVPLFIDGIPVYVPYDGYVDLRRFTTFDAATIEVQKGFSSVLLGPNALGGAINIVSRVPVAPWELDVGTGAFSGDGIKGYINAGTRQRLWYAQVGGSKIRQHDFPLSDDFTPALAQGAGDRVGSRRDDSRVSAKLGFMPERGGEYVAGYADQRGSKGNPPYAGPSTTQSLRYWRWPEWNKKSAYVVTTTPVSGSVSLLGRAYYDRFDNTLESFDDSSFTTQNRGYAFTSIYHDDTYGGSLQLGGITSGPQRLALAAHYKLDRHREYNVGEPERVFRDRTFSFAAEDHVRITDALEATAAVSYERRNALRAEGLDDDGNVIPLEPGHGDSWNPEVALTYGEAWGSLRASVARKTRFPTIKDRYSYRLGSAIPNPDLEAERATHYELAYRTPAAARWSFGASVYAYDIDDAIQQVDSVTTDSTGAYLFQLQNVGRSRAAGGEVEVGVHATSWIDALASYSYIHRRNVSQPSVYPTDVPRHKLLAQLLARPSRLVDVTVGAEWNSWRYGTSGGQRLDGFTTVEAQAGVNLPRGVRVELGSHNIFDENFELAPGFPQPGREVYINLRYSIAAVRP